MLSAETVNDQQQHDRDAIANCAPDKWAWHKAVRDSDLRPALKLLLHTLSTWMDDVGGRCWPSAEVIAEAVGVKRQTVWTQLDEVETAGWLRVVSKGGVAAGRGGSGKTNLYLPT